MDTTRKTDLQLIKEIEANSELALELLLERYYLSLSHFAFEILKSKDLTQEVVSEVFITLWESRKSMPKLQSVKAYLFTLTKNKALNSRKKEQGTISFTEEHHARKDTTPCAEERFIQQEAIAEIDRIISQMPTQRQLIFRLNRIDGLRYKEIATLLDIAVSTVQNQMMQAIKFLHDNCSDKRQLW